MSEMLTLSPINANDLRPSTDYIENELRMRCAWVTISTINALIWFSYPLLGSRQCFCSAHNVGCTLNADAINRHHTWLSHCSRSNLNVEVKRTQYGLSVFASPTQYGRVWYIRNSLNRRRQVNCKSSLLQRMLCVGTTSILRLYYVSIAYVLLRYCVYLVASIATKSLCSSKLWMLPTAYETFIVRSWRMQNVWFSNITLVLVIPNLLLLLYQDWNKHRWS